MMLRSMIVSARPHLSDPMHGMLSSFASVDLIATATGGRDALKALASNDIDVVFLDADLPQAKYLGLGDVAEGEAPKPYLILVGAEETNACTAFDLGATDFVTKPVRRSRLETAVARVARAKRQADAAAAADVHEAVETAPQRPGEVWVRQRGAAIRINLESVRRIYAEGEYVRLFVDGADYLHRESLTAIMEWIDPRRMIRIHRSFAVERSDIAVIRRLKTGSYEAVLQDGTTLSIGRTYRRNLRALAKADPVLDS
jgi:DNA-binding LytR/AlgR family response regulator